MLLASPLGGLTYVAHILYWFWRIKLEYPNHALAGVIMLLGAFCCRGEFLQEHFFDLFAVFAAYLLTGYLQSRCRETWPRTAFFWRLRLRIYLIPLAYSFYTSSWDPLIATCSGMIGCEWITWSFREYREERLQRT